MADISITDFALDNYRGTGSTAYLQIVSESDWTDIDGDSHVAESFKEIPLVVNTGVHRIDETSFDLTPTQNAVTNQRATYRFQVVDANRKNPQIIAQGVSVPYSTPVMAWGALVLLAQSQMPWRDLTCPTTTDMVNYVQLQLGAVVTPDASATVRGFVSLLAQTFAGLKTFLGGIIARVWDKGGQVYNVMAYGAACDGVTDDTVAVGLARAAALAARKPLFFPGWCLMDASGAEVILLTAPIEVFGTGKWTSGIKVKSTVGATTDIVRLKPALGAAIDTNTRGWHLHDFGIEDERGHDLNTSYAGRHGIVIDLSVALTWMSESHLHDLYVGPLGATGSGSYGIYLSSDPDAGTHPSLFTSTIECNFVYNGISLINVGDTVRVIGNTVLGENYGLTAKGQAGVTTFAAIGNNITNKLGVDIRGPFVDLIYRENIVEIFRAGSTGASPSGACVQIIGDASNPITGGVVEHNHTGAVSGVVLNGIYVEHAHRLTFGPNTYNIPATQHGIHLSSGTRHTLIDFWGQKHLTAANRVFNLGGDPDAVYEGQHLIGSDNGGLGVTLGTAAGTGATGSAAGSDMGGFFSINTGTGPAAGNATLAIIAFNIGYPVAAKSIVITPANAAAKNLTWEQQPFHSQSSTTAAAMLVAGGSAALPASAGPFIWSYQVVGQAVPAPV